MKDYLIPIYKKLQERDREALSSIYRHRCLTVNQIYTLHYDNAKNDYYCKLKVEQMLKDNLLEQTETANHTVYFLTMDGVDCVREHLGLPRNIFDSKRKVISRGYFRASELKMYEKNIDHQIALNQFYIDFHNYIGKNIEYKYYDEKYINFLNDIRPDGIISAFDMDFFIEIDMSTETKGQLQLKWENYRRFLEGSEYKYKDRKIVVLFVIENNSIPQPRIDLIKSSIYNRLNNFIDDNFEIYVDTKENLLEILKKEELFIKHRKKQAIDVAREILEEKDFVFDLGIKIAPFVNDVNFAYYYRLLNRNKSIAVIDNKVQEYLIDSYYDKPYSVIRKIQSLQYCNLDYEKKIGRKLAYIVLVEDLNDIYHDLRMLDILYMDNVYYTTLDLLKNYSYPQALVQIDTMGNVTSFKDYGLEKTEFKFNIAE